MSPAGIGRVVGWATVWGVAAMAASGQTIVTGPGTGAGPHVKVFDGVDLEVLHSLFAFSPAFTGGITVATGDVNADGTPDLIAGAGPTGGPHVQVFSGVDLEVLRSFFAFTPSFTGGIYVAAGDVNDDDAADLIVGAGPGGGPHVKVFDGLAGTEIKSFFAYDPGFLGGVRVGAGDVNGDGFADLVTGPGPGAGPHVKVFDGVTGAELRSFFAFAPSFTGGVFVAAGDYDRDGLADVVVGADEGGAPEVKVFAGSDNSLMTSFLAFDEEFTGGVRVAAGDIETGLRAELVVGAGPGGGSQVKAFRWQGAFIELHNFFAYDPGFLGGVFVAAPPAPPLPEPTAELLLVDDDANGPDVGESYVEALEVLGVPFDVWDTENSDEEPRAAFLAGYGTVVWFTGSAFAQGGPGAEAEGALATWLDQGGCFLISSQDYHFARGLTALMSSHLGVASVTDDVGQTQVEGSGVFAGLGPFELAFLSFSNFSDEIEPQLPASVAFTGDLGNAATAKAGLPYRTAFLGFPLEAVANVDDRAAVLEAFFRYCRELTPLIFEDGFESGDTSAWSG